MSSLNPCPSCGGEAQTDVGKAGQAAAFCDLFRSYCMDCGTQSPEWSYTEAEAITAWNTRCVNTHDALVKALVEAAEFIQPFNSGQDLLERIDAALALAKGEGE